MELIKEGYYWIKQGEETLIAYYYKKGDHFRTHESHNRIPFNSVHTLGRVSGEVIQPVVECEHEWKYVHNGYCRDCIKCGRGE